MSAPQHIKDFDIISNEPRSPVARTAPPARKPNANEAEQFDPITHKSVLSPRRTSFARAKIVRGENSGTKDNFNILDGNPVTEHSRTQFPRRGSDVGVHVADKFAPTSLVQLRAEENKAYDPMTGKERPAHMLQRRSSSGSLRQEVERNGKNVHPLTGEVVVPPVTRTPSSGALKKDWTSEHVNPITGQPAEH